MMASDEKDMQDDEGPAPKRYATHEEMMADKCPDDELDQDNKSDDDEAAASPNYDADMRLDARAIAEFVKAQVQAHFPHIEARVEEVVCEKHGHKGDDSPLPTLESLRAEIAAGNRLFDAVLTDLRKEREGAREDSLARKLICALHYGAVHCLRDTLGDDAQAAVFKQLTGNELERLYAQRLGENPVYALAMGAYIGALLTREGLRLNEVIACGSDPVFALHGLFGRVNPRTATALALEVISEEHRLRAERDKTVS